MTRYDFRFARILPVLLLAALLAACSGGGGGGDVDDGGNGGDGDGNGIAPPASDHDCAGSGLVTVSGTAEYEFVPAVSDAFGTRLDYGSSTFKPIRGAEVEAVCPDGSVTYATAITDAAGAYALSVPENVDVAVRVRASMTAAGGPSWDVKVVDNTQGQGVWSVQGDVFDSGTGSVEVNLRAGSGWTGSGYTGTRAAAPFAILDSVFMAMQKVLAADSDAAFPALKLNWSPQNTGCSSDLEDYPFPDGCIGTSFFANFGGSAGRNIFILGAANNDTDEYDNHVVIHEWGHYYEDAFSRSDSIGGRHGGGDPLDPRVAFGEGWGNAFSGIAIDDPLYVDTMGSRQGNGFSINIEGEPEAAPGWWNEASVQEIIYDLYDAANDDPAALGFAPIHLVLTGGQRSTAAMTTLFPLVHFLKQANAAGNIEDVVASHDIATIVDEWGSGRSGGGVLSGEANDNGSEFAAGFETYVTPVHRDLGTVDSGTSVTACTSNRLDSSSEYNRLGTRRFLRFQVGVPGGWNIRLEGAGSGVAGSDPDFYLRLRGDIVAIGDDDSSGSGIETETATLAAGQTYVIEVYDWINVNEASDGGDICLDLSFEQALL